MRGQPIVFENFSGGVNQESAPYAVDNSQARDALNVTTSPIGSVRKRNGFATIGSPTLPITSLWTYERGSTRYLVGIGDNGTTTDLYSMTTGGTFTSRKAALTIATGVRWEGIQAPISGGQGPVYMLNGSNAALYWSGTGNAAAWTASTGTVPNGKYILYHDNRVIVAGVETDYTTRSTLYASALADPRDWASPNGVSTLLDPDDGEEISGIGTVGPYVITFKPRKTYIVHNTNTLGYRNLSDDIGCVAHRSIVGSDKGTFFLTSDKKIAITDGSSISHISLPIDPLLQQIPSSKLANTAGYYYKDRYYLSFSTSTDNDTIVEYDTRNSSWWIHKIYLTSAVTTAVNDWALLDPQGAATLYAAGSSTATPRVFEAFKPDQYFDRSDADSKSAYSSYWISGWNTFGAPHIRKIIRQIRADALGDYQLYTTKSFASTYTTEETNIWETAESEGGTFGGAGLFGGTGTFGEIVSPSERRFYTPGVGRAWSLKFQSDDTQSWELYSYTMAIDSRTD